MNSINIAKFFIVLNLLSGAAALYTGLVILSTLPILGGWFIIVGLIYFVSAVAMFKRLDWGRKLFLIFYPLSLVISFFLGSGSVDTMLSPRSIFSIALYLASLYIFTRPEVVAYFQKKVATRV